MHRHVENKKDVYTFITGDENSQKKLSRKYQCAMKMFAVIL